MQLTARIWSEEGRFVAECVELKVVSQGDTEDEALANLPTRNDHRYGHPLFRRCQLSMASSGRPLGFISAQFIHVTSRLSFDLSMRT
jgi:hypothetical protein